MCSLLGLRISGTVLIAISGGFCRLRHLSFIFQLPASHTSASDERATVSSDKQKLSPRLLLTRLTTPATLVSLFAEGNKKVELTLR
jgi:hypothetical protein